MLIHQPQANIQQVPTLHPVLGCQLVRLYNQADMAQCSGAFSLAWKPIHEKIERQWEVWGDTD